MVDASRTLSITEARKRIFELADEVRPGVHFTLTEKGRPRMVMMSPEEYEGWMETFDVMMEMPNLSEVVKQARKEYAQGKFITLSDLRKKYEVPRRTRSKRSKRVR